MSRSPFSHDWLFSALGCGFLLSALLWQPPFQRELVLAAVVALVIALIRFLRRFA